MRDDIVIDAEGDFHLIDFKTIGSLDLGIALHEAIGAKICAISTPRDKGVDWSKYLDIHEFIKEVRGVELLPPHGIILDSIDCDLIGEIDVHFSKSKPKTKTPHHTKSWKNKKYF